MTFRNIGLALALAASSAALSGADNSLGTWKRNIEKSKSSTPVANPYKTQTSVREASGGGVKVTSTGERKDGTLTNSTYTAKYDGVAVPVTGSAAFDTISVKQLNANTFTAETRKTGGKYHTTGKTVISKNGKTMTTTVKGTDAEGKPTSFTVVSDKQ